MPHTIAINKLKKDLVAMGEMCEYALTTALMALLDRDSDLAAYVMDFDAEIDEMELAVDRDCMELLQSGVLSGPDIRFVAAASKINNDLERIGDLAVTVCEHVMFLVRERSILPQVLDFQDMLEQIGQMIRESLEALIQRDVSLTWKILDERKIADDEIEIIYRELLDIMKKDDRAIERCCHILFIVQALRRVADQSANIAEEVIFTEEGVAVRHHIREFHPIMPDPYGADGDAEKEVLATRKSREELLAEQARSKTRVIAREEMPPPDEAARAKAKKAREKLLKMRNERASR